MIVSIFPEITMVSPSSYVESAVWTEIKEPDAKTVPTGISTKIIKTENILKSIIFEIQNSISLLLLKIKNEKKL